MRWSRGRDASRGHGDAAAEARRRSLAALPGLGFPQPPSHLPLVADAADPLVLVDEEQVVQRALVLTVRVNLALRMPPELARAWLAEQGLLASLSPRERALLSGEVEPDDSDEAQVEALWALAWVLGLVPELDASEPCGDQLASLMPDLRTSEPVAAWRSRTGPRRRDVEDVLPVLDLHLALTWGITDARLAGRPHPGRVDPSVLWERRRALEWTAGDGVHDSWDDVDLST